MVLGNLKCLIVKLLNQQCWSIFQWLGVLKKVGLGDYNRRESEVIVFHLLSKNKLTLVNWEMFTCKHGQASILEHYSL